jgi:hypothetical protein
VTPGDILASANQTAADSAYLFQQQGDDVAVSDDGERILDQMSPPLGFLTPHPRTTSYKNLRSSTRRTRQRTSLSPSSSRTPRPAPLRNNSEPAVASPRPASLKKNLEPAVASPRRSASRRLFPSALKGDSGTGNRSFMNDGSPALHGQFRDRSESIDPHDLNHSAQTFDNDLLMDSYESVNRSTPDLFVNSDVDLPESSERIWIRWIATITNRLGMTLHLSLLHAAYQSIK